jgi:hypothetical protein
MPNFLHLLLTWNDLILSISLVSQANKLFLFMSFILSGNQYNYWVKVKHNLHNVKHTLHLFPF